MTTTSPTLRHAYFCLERPGADGPRLESYDAPRYGEDGTTHIGVVRVVRCQECGAATYDGVARG